MLSRKAEDYLKAILEIESKKGYARIKDIASLLNVKAPSVTEMVKKLDKEGYVRYVKYESINLTPKGNSIAKTTKNRHDLLKALLRDIIKVPEKIAEKDACIIEHELDDITLEKIRDFVNSSQQTP
jgi:DtxR family Mn-dependent transcriptional regulator